MKSDISKFLASSDISIVEAMQRIDENAEGILFIVEDHKLIGSLTDGDLRRFIIKYGNLDSLIDGAINRSPKYVLDSEIENASKIMEQFHVYCVPVVDVNKQIIDIVFNDIHKERMTNSTALKDIPIVIMAGGKGTRLYPFTKILPKPLIPIGDVPILERIINRYCSYGSNDFYLTVNYKKEMIKSYFTDLAPTYDITYVEESKPLGTAGSLRLIETKFESTIIVTNCDILIEADYEKIIAYHRSSGNAMTIVSSLKNTVIPYGVLHSTENGMITSMEEKPKLSCFINTGMYILEPQFIELIPEDTFYHMPSLAEQLISSGEKVGMYPISENSFLDMGEFEEMKKMEDRINSGEIS